MTEAQPPTPRRALGPLDDDATASGGRFGFGSFDADDADDFDELDPGEQTVVLRRLAFTPASPASPASPADFDDADDPGATSRATSAGAPVAASATPVPPPRPVLPEPEAALAPAAGRRYSADTAPDDYDWVAPRRSAASPLSPASPSAAIEPVLPPPPTRPTAPPEVVRPGAAIAAAESAAAVGSAAKPGKAGRSKPAGKRNHKPLVIIFSAVAAFILLVAGVVYLVTLNSTAPSGLPTASAATSALDPNLTAADLGSLGGVAWSTATDTDETPLCLPAEADGLPTAQRTTSRKVTAGEGSAESVVNVVATYADVAAATAAYQLRSGQAGTCPDTSALITGANSITGLADEAIAVRLTVQDDTDVFHSLQVARTGRTVSLVDVTTTKAEVTADDVARATMPSLNRQCTGSEGTCPTSIVVAAVPPPAGTLPGWLVEADLPRITPGAGRWGATDPATSLHLIGSQCEVIDLNTVAGTTSVGQRTFLLADDAAAPSGFGVDQAVYGFGGSTAATKLRDKLAKNIGACADRTPTASVKKGPAIKGTGESGAKISGSTYLVTHKTETNTVLYRVAVLTVDNAAVYLLANPSTGFDFTDSTWRELALRAGQRVSQGS